MTNSTPKTATRPDQGTPKKTASAKKSSAANKKGLKHCLLAAQQSLGTVEADSVGWRGREQYQYASAEAVIRAARDALAQNGLLAYRAGWMLPEFFGQDGVTVEGNAAVNGPPVTSLVKSVLRVECLQTDEFIEEEVTSIATQRYGMPLDRAIAAVLTGQLAYWLRDLLLIPRGHVEDPGTPSQGTAPQSPPPAANPNAVMEMATRSIQGASASEQLDRITERIHDHPDLDDDNKATLLQLVAKQRAHLETPHQEATHDQAETL